MIKIADIYPILFVISSALATVFIDGLVSDIPSILVLFVVSSIAIVYFNCINVHKISYIYAQVMQKPLLLFTVNFLLATTWVATYLGISYLGASVYNIFYFSISATLATLIDNINKKHNYLIALLIIITLVTALFILDLSIIGVFLSLFGGISGFLYRKYSFKLAKDNNLTSSQVLAIRFWLLWGVVYYFAPIKQIYNFISFYYIGLIVAVAFISFILQNWLNQQGIIIAGVKRSTTILAFTPLVTILCQYLFLNEIYFNWVVLSIICLAIIFSTNLCDLVKKPIKK